VKLRLYLSLKQIGFIQEYATLALILSQAFGTAKPEGTSEAKPSSWETIQQVAAGIF